MQNKLRSRVEIFILRLDDLVSFLRIETAASINASRATEFNRLEYSENVREKDHSCLCEYD